jgi:hypothetical protein
MEYRYDIIIDHHELSDRQAKQSAGLVRSSGAQTPLKHTHIPERNQPHIGRQSYEVLRVALKVSC